MRRFLRSIPLLVGMALADDPILPATITADQRARFWRAQAEVMAAELRTEKAVNALQAVQAEMMKTCGTPLLFDASGEPACAPDPGKKQRE